MLSQHKEFGVYHWDIFDNEVFFKQDFDTLEEAENYVEKEYKGRIRPTGADQVDIVKLSTKTIVEKYSVG